MTPPKDTPTRTARVRQGPEDRRDQFSGDRSSAAPEVEQPAIGVVGWLRWGWRQLTTMRVALMLLLMLALASIPGSILPQRIQDPSRVTQYIQDNGGLGEFFDAIQLFDVYSSVWFSAIYILLLISLVGCIIPRVRTHWKAMRAQPPVAPKRMARMPAHVVLTVRGDGAASSDAPGEADAAGGADGPTAAASRAGVLDEAQALLKRRGYRIRREQGYVAAERGYLRETGNIVFHISIVGVVLATALGGLFGYSGQRVVVDGDTFSNSLLSYDSFNKGAWFNPDNLVNYTVRLDQLDTSFNAEGRDTSQFSQPRQFDARTTTRVGDREWKQTVRPNQPLDVDGSRLFLTGNGYAPVVTVRDGRGRVVFSGATVFLPQDGMYLSSGVIKVPDAQPRQLGFNGVFLPTAGPGPDGVITSTFAQSFNPVLVLSGFSGDLGLDTGIPQSVYTLKPDNMTRMLDANRSELVIQLSVGQTSQLPDGLGSVTFDGVRRYAAFDVQYNPGVAWMLWLSLAGLAGLALSLFVPRRRLWVTVGPGDSVESVEIAGLARGEDSRLLPEVETVARQLAERVPGASAPDDAPAPSRGQ